MADRFKVITIMQAMHYLLRLTVRRPVHVFRMLDITVLVFEEYATPGGDD